MASRINTGFHRLGIVLSAPLLIAALILAYREWTAPSGTVPSSELAEGALAIEAKQLDAYSEQLVAEQEAMGLRLPPKYIVVGVPGDMSNLSRPVKRTATDDPEAAKRLGLDSWMLFTLPDTRVVAIGASDEKQAIQCAFEFLWRQKLEGRAFTPDHPYPGQNCRIGFESVYDDFPAGKGPITTKMMPTMNLFFTFALVGLAAVLYLLSRAIGWIVAGFAGA